jgi:hypothetical protein
LIEDIDFEFYMKLAQILTDFLAVDFLPLSEENVKTSKCVKTRKIAENY